jgi:CheY-like chemotaxis protein
MNLALEESVRLREEVDRISRHDLKTPLNSIIGIPRLLRDSGRFSAEDAELLTFVEQAGYRLLNMINLSLDMFQMERGGYPFTPKPVDLRDLLGKVLRDVEHHARSKRIALRIEGPRLYALAEELLCYSMFANLVKNAVEASPEGGEILLEIGAIDGAVRVSVHNAGAVPESVRARFFDKYSSAGKLGGSGLGTYSARLIARTQKGDIEMQTSEASGTTLRVRLMQASASEIEAATAKSEAQAEQGPPKELQPLSVLVVDDDEYTRVFVQRFLPATMRTRTAVNGREALEAVRQEPPDVIVMDLDMPVMGGLEAAAQIRQWERDAGRARCAMIAMSSNDGPAVGARCGEAGFDRYLAKPVSPDVLRRALAELSLAGDAVFVDPDLKDALPGFLESRREMADALARALVAGTAEAARALAHKLAGSLALYGFDWAAQQSRMIEKRARENRLEGLAGEAAALRRHLDGVRVKFAGKQTAEDRA